VNRLIFVVSLFFLSAPVLAETVDEAFENLASEYIGDLGNLSPVYATLMGNHSADGQIDRVDNVARAESRALLLEYREALKGIDREQLSRANQVDAELLSHAVESALWSLDVFKEWAWNPLQYVSISGSAIYGLMARDFAPVETRLLNVAARLEQLPRFFAQARSSLDSARVPKIHAETAVRQNPGLSRSSIPWSSRRWRRFLLSNGKSWVLRLKPRRTRFPGSRPGWSRSCCPRRKATFGSVQSCITPSSLSPSIHR
jgi:hypothetical protein